MKTLKHLIVAFALISISFSFSSCGYNNLVSLDEGVESQWAQVENAYQRRADLIPNLVNTVKGAANFEKETLESVIQARSQATSINVDADDLTPEKLQQFEAAQQKLGGALSRLLVSVERYPELKANANFQTLQSQLEGTENRISTERKKFNDAAKDYNTYVRSFPQTITASLFGFKRKPYFESEAGSEVPPTVDFD